MEFEHKITIIGSTGSIGTQTLEIVRENPGIRVMGLSAYGNTELLEKQAREFMPEIVCCVDEEKAKLLKTALADTAIKVIAGQSGVAEVACVKSAETVVTAVVGIAGLLPTIAAIKAGKNIALANKETLVTAGHIVTRLCREYGVKLLPVDSEHSAIFQALQGNERNKIKKILLTASGGPFFGRKKADLRHITPAQALKHPNWSMGAKVTIDSATMANKGLEVMEAKWLFDVDIDQIEVLVHRQSVVHSMVEYEDNAVIAQLGAPDMRLPIQYAVTYPKRLPIQKNALDFAKYPALTFEKPDMETFPALALAYAAGRIGGLMPCIFNSSDEAAVELFLQEKIPYLQIAEIIEKTMEKMQNVEDPTVEQILETDRAVRELVHKSY